MSHLHAHARWWRRLLVPLAMLAAAGLAGAAAPPARAAAPAASVRAAKPAARAVLPWIEDDYPRAVALARARKVPIFVESWAPW
jgi:hypothetical protein